MLAWHFLCVSFHSGDISGSKQEACIGEEDDLITPMKKIEKSRAKWRKKEADLEESWGSLSFFNKSQRGRLSIDMNDDDFEEYLSPTKKDPAPSPARQSDKHTDKHTEAPPKLPLPTQDTQDSWSDEEDFTIPSLPQVSFSFSLTIEPLLDHSLSVEELQNPQRRVECSLLETAYFTSKQS